nr:MAG: internal scaffolding protein [Microvirus sp.]
MFVNPDTGEVVTPFLRTAYNYDADGASQESGLDCSDLPSLTQQQFRDEVNINTIVERFGLTGQLPDDVKVPMQGDFTDVVDYQSALNAVIAADNAFMELPAAVREEFRNDPQRLMDFVADEKNRARAEELGILNPKPLKAPPLDVRVVPEENAGSGPGST